MSLYFFFRIEGLYYWPNQWIQF